MKPDSSGSPGALLEVAEAQGRVATLKTYFRLSGPGWLQSAITLGGGSLAGSLYLGIIGGYELLWLQPLMMAFGVVMLSAIAHVALATGERPLDALRTHVNPVLAWGWVVATLMANLVWAMPQFSLGAAALRQNLGLFTFDHGDAVAALLLALASGVVVWLYDASARAYRVFDALLKLMVGVVVVCFFLVVVMVGTGETGLPWGRILTGFIPHPSLIWEPAESLAGLVAASSAPDYWTETVVSAQRDRMVAAAATAVGINMTFLLPYSMMKRGWDRRFLGLARFDLGMGLFLPFVLATSCVVIAAASQFHARPEAGLITGNDPSIAPALRAAYEANLDPVLQAAGTPADAAARQALPESDRILAATLIRRDAFDLARSLEKLGGTDMAQKLFGVGVVGMAVSSIIILMLINGFAVCEMLGRPSRGWLYRLGCAMPAVSGALGALFLWSGKAQFYLAVPTSRFGMVLLPIAYIAFFCLMNNGHLLGGHQPRGRARWIWNSLMIAAIMLALGGAALSILNDTSTVPGTDLKVRHLALGLLAGLTAWALALQFSRKKTLHPPT